MSIRKTCLLILLLLASALLFGQQFYMDVVYLKDGSVYRGVIIENIINEHIRIKIVDDNIMVIAYEKIAKIERNEVAPQLKPKTSGYFNHSNFGLLFGGAHSGGPTLGSGLRTMIGYRFEKNFSIAGGVGVENLSATGFFPTYIDARYYLSKGEVAPFVFGQGGYSFPSGGMNSRLEGGGLAGGGMGFIHYVKNKTAWSFSIGYHYQESFSRFTDWGGLPIERTDYYRRVTVRCGFIFY